MYMVNRRGEDYRFSYSTMKWSSFQLKMFDGLPYVLMDKERGTFSKYKEKNQCQISVKIIKYHRDVASLCEEDDPSEKLTMLS